MDNDLSLQGWLQVSLWSTGWEIGISLALWFVMYNVAVPVVLPWQEMLAMFEYIARYCILVEMLLVVAGIALP